MGAAYLTTAEAAAIARKHPVTIRLALEGKTLHGTQQKAGGRWTIKVECLAAFLEGEPCEHAARAKAANVTPIRRAA